MGCVILIVGTKSFLSSASIGVSIIFIGVLAKCLCSFLCIAINAPVTIKERQARTTRMIMQTGAEYSEHASALVGGVGSGRGVVL
jgi:hypothetical protein